jgi:hypothetical protein
MDNTFVRSVINSNNLISAPSYFCWKCQLTDKSPICSGYYKISTSSLFCLEAQFEGRFYIIYRCYTNCMKWRDLAFCFFCIQLKFAPRVLILLRQFLHSILLVRVFELWTLKDNVFFIWLNRFIFILYLKSRF